MDTLPRPSRIGDVDLKDDRDRWLLLFSHPADAAAPPRARGLAA